MATPAQDRKIAAPAVTPDTQVFWEAAKQGTLLLKKCPKCEELHYYPRPHCPFCFHDQTEWVEAQGTGVIYTFSVTRRAEIPYAFAYVTLDEGVTMMTNIVDCDLDAIRIGQKVKVVFKPTIDGPPVPMFAPL